MKEYIHSLNFSCFMHSETAQEITQKMKSPPQILPPPPPLNHVPPGVVPFRTSPMKTMKPTMGSKGKRVSLLTNHFKVTVSGDVLDFYHYNVLVCYEDGLEVTKRNTKMAVIEKLCQTYKTNLDVISPEALVYDGDRSLFTPRPLAKNNMEFSVVQLHPVSAKGMNGNDQKRQRIDSRSTTFKVQIKFVSKILMKTVNGSTSHGGLRVLNTILQQRALKRGCLVVRGSFFENEPSNFIDVGNGVLGCRGWFSSFRAVQGGLYFNHDVSMTTIIQPGSVIDFLIKNQNVKTPFKINWNEASRTLKGLRFKVKHLQSEFKIAGFSEKPCKEQKFSLKMGGANGCVLAVETTVLDYFVKTRGIELTFSENLACINAGKPKKPIFFPIEICSLIPLQRNKKELTAYQKSAMIMKSRQKPEELIKVLDNEMKRIKLEDEQSLQSYGISINSSFVQADGRILTAPRLRMGNGEIFFPRNGWWTIKDKKLAEPKGLENWAIVKFSSCDVRKMCEMLPKISSAKGMAIKPPLCVIEENPKHKKKPASVRVQMMFEQIHSKFRKKPPQFILCLLADKKLSDLYGPWKRKTIVEFGIPDQCISSSKIDEHYLTNILLKINAKLGGFNHTVNSEVARTIPMVSMTPTMILGMEISHGQANAPSIASVVGSREWPRISSYRACLRAVPPKSYMIDSLFKPTPQHEDAGMIRELLLEFYSSSGQKKPSQIVIFRNGLSTSQFDQILKVETEQILMASSFLEENWRPKLTVIVSQRRHHTKFFDATKGVNVTPGTIVDREVCDIGCTNFYMCAHAARIGSLRPTHYHMLLNEIGFSSDDLQEFIHSLSYVFQRSNNAISEVAPVRYARLAAAKISDVLGRDRVMNELPKVHKNLSSSMFFI